jgi:hypothetical protein
LRPWVFRSGTAFPPEGRKKVSDSAESGIPDRKYLSDASVAKRFWESWSAMASNAEALRGRVDGLLRSTRGLESLVNDETVRLDGPVDRLELVVGSCPPKHGTLSVWSAIDRLGNRTENSLDRAAVAAEVDKGVQDAMVAKLGPKITSEVATEFGAIYETLLLPLHQLL